MAPYRDLYDQDLADARTDARARARLDDVPVWHPPVYTMAYSVVIGLLMWTGIAYVVRAIFF